MTFVDRLEEASARLGTPAVVGLDPHLPLLPEPFARAARPETDPAERADLVERFLAEVIDLASGRVPAVKPQSAFFELLGTPGAAVWERTVARAHDAGLLVVGDVKRGDIASTAAAYATAFLEGLPGTDPASLPDAITIHPFLGAESIEPFVQVARRTGRGLYVLVRTSNPGAAGYQTGSEPPLSARIARDVDRWGSPCLGSCGLSNVGAVVGATHPSELCELRAAMPRSPLLLPGYGAQGAGAADVAPGFLAPDPTRPAVRPYGAIVNSSRGILFAQREEPWCGLNWKDAARSALDRMIGELASALDPRVGP